jgi:hypothetical protein
MSTSAERKSSRSDPAQDFGTAQMVRVNTVNVARQANGMGAGLEMPL